MGRYQLDIPSAAFSPSGSLIYIANQTPHLIILKCNLPIGAIVQDAQVIHPHDPSFYSFPVQTQNLPIPRTIEEINQRIAKTAPLFNPKHFTINPDLSPSQK